MRAALSPPRGLAVLAGSLLLAGLALAAPRARAACRASANNAFSFDTRLKPVAGQVCRMTVDVFAGGACGQPPRWQVILPCDQAGHTAISNNGRLISILLPRTKSQDLNVIRVTWGSEKFALANLRKLTPPGPGPGQSPLRGEVRIDFDGDGLRLKADRTFVIPFETVRKLTSSVSD
jgi:hypothetical protein